MRPGFALVVVSVAVLLAGSLASAADAHVTRITPEAAVAGTVVDVSGSGFSGPGVKVFVGGRAARVLAVRKGRLRFVVPRLSPGLKALVIRTGPRTLSLRLRVLRAFNGKIHARVDRSRARSAAIGAAGGTIAARGRDGTRYTLTVPAGALTQEQRITVTPVVAFTNLPVTGGRPAGASFAPDGLTFAIPATLTIVAAHRFPRNTIAFSAPNGKPGFDAQFPKGSGRARTVRIEHFSVAVLTPAQAADFARAIQPILDQVGVLSIAGVHELVDLLGAWEEMFDGFCADLQPVVCATATAKALHSMDVRGAQACTSGRAHPTLRAIRALVEIQGLRASLGADDDPTRACQEAIYTAVVAAAKTAAESDPLAVAAIVADEPPGLAGSDIDHDGKLTHIELLFLLAALGSQAAFDVPAATALQAASDEMHGLAADGPAACNTNRVLGEARVRKGLSYATTRFAGFIDEFVAALDGCVLVVHITPSTTGIGPGAQQQFTASVSPLADPSHATVTWTTTGGTISAGGLYTAPAAAGAYDVTATSTLNPARRATATITVQAADPNDFKADITSGACNSAVTGGAPCDYVAGDVSLGVSATNSSPRPALVTIKVIPNYLDGVPSVCTTSESAPFTIAAGATLQQTLAINCHFTTTFGGTSGDQDVDAQVCVVGGGCGKETVGFTIGLHMPG